jgi:ankyrin repeat protein
MDDDTILRLDSVDSYTNIPCTTQKIIISNYKDEYYSKLKIPFGCKLYEEDQEITLLYACAYGLRETAIGIIYNNQVDNVAEIDKYGRTALFWACYKSMWGVATLLITTFGDRCNPQQANVGGHTALIWACYRSVPGVAILLITTFGDKCNPQQVNRYGETALSLASKNKLNDVVALIKQFS